MATHGLSAENNHKQSNASEMSLPTKHKHTPFFSKSHCYGYEMLGDYNDYISQICIKFLNAFTNYTTKIKAGGK